MWTKDDYQDHMLGYLDGVRVEFEQLIRARRQPPQRSNFYADLDIALECLQRLMRAGDTEWEEFRYRLEVSCDALLHTFYGVPRGRVLRRSVRFAMAEADVRRAPSHQAAAMQR